MSGRLSGSSDPQPTITQYQDRGHSQTFRIEPKVGSNFPDPVAHCVLPTLGRQRKQWNFLPPIYDQSPSWLLDSCHRAIHHSSHTKQSCAPPLSLCLSVPPWVSVPPPSRNSQELTCVPEKCDSLPSSTPIPLHHIFCIGNQRCVLLLTHYMDKRGLSVEDQ